MLNTIFASKQKDVKIGDRFWVWHIGGTPVISDRAVVKFTNQKSFKLEGLPFNFYHDNQHGIVRMDWENSVIPPICLFDSREALNSEIERRSLVCQIKKKCAIATINGFKSFDLKELRDLLNALELRKSRRGKR